MTETGPAVQIIAEQSLTSGPRSDRQSTASRMRSAVRNPYTFNDLKRLIAPRSIAVVGASNRPGSFGARTLANLAGFQGALWPINPKATSIGGLPCYASLRDLPGVPDCAVLAIRREDVPAAVEEAVELGVGGLIIYASGFGETGVQELIDLQDRLTAMVAGTGTRILGPNCLGITNYAIGARILFGRMPEAPPPEGRGIGLVVQSGSISMSLGQAAERGVAISHALPCGNAADVSIPDLVNYLIDDPDCASIACTFEGITNPGHLVQVARRARAAGKPLVVYKMASSEAGAAAALSHTGAMTGSHRTQMAWLRDAGAIIVDRMEDLIETAAFFAKAPPPRGKGVAIVLASGGLGVIAADKAEDHGVALPQPEGETLRILQTAVPEFGAARNPCDVTAQALSDGGPMEICADAMLADPAYGCLLVMHPYADAFGSARVALWSKLAAKHGKIICSYWSSEALQGHGAAEVEREPNIATFRSLDRCFAALRAWWDRGATETDASPPARLSDPQAAAQTRALLAACGQEIPSATGRRILQSYGIPLIPEVLVQSPDAAVTAAAQMGYPVVMKIDSPDILHKTEVGGVRLSLQNADQVTAAWQEIEASVVAAAPDARINGITLQPMASAGVELVLGATVDHSLGPQLVIGMGGILVELLNDREILPLPTTPEKILAALGKLRGAKLLDGFRGADPVDKARLTEVIQRFAEMVTDNAGDLSEIELNPLICTPRRIVAVDLLAVRSAAAREGAAA